MKLSSTTFILLGSHHGFKQAAVAATSSPTYAPTVTFEFFGPGYCADSRSRLYSTALQTDFVNTTEDCSAWCLQNPDNLLGFSFSASYEECVCEFDGGELPSPVPVYINPPVLEYEIGNGTGAIQQTSLSSGGTAFDCYVYPEFAPPSLFSKVGNGECIDSEGNGFSYFGRLNIFDETIDQQCEDYCSQNLVSTFVGFETHISFEPESLEPDTECRCLFNGGQLPISSVTNYTNVGRPDIGFSRSGDGIITNVTQQTNDDFGFGFGGGTSCYRYNIASQTDAPTYLPTYLPTSYLPTYLPTNSPMASPTATPSQSPTVSPSASPSTNPTQTPSSSPSSSPSNTLTDSPTHMPTKVPTLSPLFEPEEPGLRSSPPVTVGPATTAPSSQPLTSGPTSCYSGKASKNAKNAKVTDESSKSSKSNYPCNGKSSKSESYSGKSSKSNYSSSGYTSPKTTEDLTTDQSNSSTDSTRDKETLNIKLDAECQEVIQSNNTAEITIHKEQDDDNNPLLWIGGGIAFVGAVAGLVFANAKKKEHYERKTGENYRFDRRQ
eukprot:scaffold4229_cov38-Cyclotella_meneghiniana.AAC.4